MIPAESRERVMLPASASAMSVDPASRGGQVPGWRGGRRAFGFARDGRTLVAAEAAEINAAAHALLSGMPLPQIAADLRRRGVTTAAAARWTSVGVARMLCRARNAGLAEYRGFITGPAPCPAVLPVSVWRAVLGAVHDPARSLLSPLAAQCLGAGLYECHCGGTVRVFIAAATPARAHYTCQISKHWTRPAQLVDSIVCAAMIERLSQEEIHVRLPVAAAGAGGLPDIDTAVGDAQAEAGRWVDRYVRGEVSAVQLATHVGGLRHQVGRLRAGLGHAASAVATVLAGDVGAGWATLRHAQKRALIHLLCRVVVLPTASGRRRGWTPGQSYADAQSVHIEWKPYST